MAEVIKEQTKVYRHIVRQANGTVKEVESTSADDIIEEDFDKIPIIDVGGMFSDDISERKKVGLLICEAAEKVGFMYFKNHHVPQETLDMIFNEAKRFFAKPLEKKMEIFRDAVPDKTGKTNYEGYHPIGQFNVHKRKFNDCYEALNFSEERKYDPEPQPPLEGDYCYENKFPEDDPQLKENVFKYHGTILTLARKMCGVVALGLNLPENYFEEDLKYPICGGRLIHYPTQEGSPEEQNGIGAHIDFSFLTFLLQDSVGGLQVMNKRGQWVKATPIDGTFVVNVGDILTRYTNGKFLGTVHRVVNTSGKERYSIPIFLYPSRNAVMKPLPTCIKEGESPKFEVTTVGECVDWHLARVTALKALKAVAEKQE